MDTAVVRKSARPRRHQSYVRNGTRRPRDAGTGRAARLAAGRDAARRREWLVHAQNPDGSWGGFPKGSPSVEETALAVEALASLPCDGDTTAAVSSGAGWLTKRIESAEWLHPSPIGFYFAKLWYYERLYPMIFTVAALGKARDYLAQSRQFTDRGSHPSARVLPAVS